MAGTIRRALRVIWSDEDGEHVGLCNAYPSLSWLAASSEEALRGIEALVAEADDSEDDSDGNTEPEETR